MSRTFSIKVLQRPPRLRDGAKMVDCLWIVAAFPGIFYALSVSFPISHICAATRLQFYFACYGSISSAGTAKWPITKAIAARHFNVRMGRNVS